MGQSVSVREVWIKKENWKLKLELFIVAKLKNLLTFPKFFFGLWHVLE